jgi:hypothetical protein
MLRATKRSSGKLKKLSEMTGTRVTAEYKLVNQLSIIDWLKCMEGAHLREWEERWVKCVLFMHHRDGESIEDIGIPRYSEDQNWEALLASVLTPGEYNFDLIPKNVDENEIMLILESLLRKYKG